MDQGGGGIHTHLHEHREEHQCGDGSDHALAEEELVLESFVAAALGRRASSLKDPGESQREGHGTTQTTVALHEEGRGDTLN